MSSPASAVPRIRNADALQRASGSLSTTAMARMETDFAWFGDLSAQERSWVGMIVQAGIKGFVDWYRATADGAQPDGGALATSVFGAAPRALAGAITLGQTVDLIRLSIDVVEGSLDDLLDHADAPHARASVSRYAREVAFATAEVYARAAELRGAWDARLEALVVDAVLRAEADETILSRASALGWSARGDVAVVLGGVPARRTETDLFDEVRRRAQTEGMDALCAVQGDRLVVVLGGVRQARPAALVLADLFAAGPVVVGPVEPGLGTAHVSARGAVSAHRAAAGWPEAPRPVLSDELLPERVLGGDGHARRHVVEEIYVPLLNARGTLIETLAGYFASGSSIEGTGRALFVHPNTVRYRLRQVAELTGYSPTMSRDALLLQMALVLGRQSGRSAQHL